MKGCLLRLSKLLLASLIPAFMGTPGVLAAEDPEAAVRTQFKGIQAAMDRDDREGAVRLAAACLNDVRGRGLLALLPEALLMNGEALMGSIDEKGSKGYLLNALGLACELNDRRVQANALNDLGILCERDELNDAAEAYYREAYELAKTLDDPQLMDAVTYDLATMECQRGDLASGYERMQAVLQSARSRNDRFSMVKTLVRLAEIERDLARIPQAEATAQEALQLSLDIKHPLSEQGASRVLSAIAVSRGDAAGAEAHLKRALAAAIASKDSFAQANAAFELGEFYAAHKRSNEAQAQLRSSEGIFRRLGRGDIADQLLEAIEKIKEGKPLKE